MFVCIKMDLALNNLQWLICHKIKPNQSFNTKCLVRWSIIQKKIINIAFLGEKTDSLNKDLNIYAFKRLL